MEEDEAGATDVEAAGAEPEGANGGMPVALSAGVPEEMRCLSGIAGDAAGIAMAERAGACAESPAEACAAGRQAARIMTAGRTIRMRVVDGVRFMTLPSAVRLKSGSIGDRIA